MKSKDKRERKEKLKEGDLFEFGMLCQLWLVKKVRGKLRAYVVSLDSGWGYWEDAEDIERMADIEDNHFSLMGNIKVKPKFDL